MNETFIEINCEGYSYTSAVRVAAGGSLGIWFDRAFTLITVFMKDQDISLSLPLRFSLSSPCYFLDLLADSDLEIFFLLFQEIKTLYSTENGLLVYSSIGLLV